MNGTWNAAKRLMLFASLLLLLLIPQLGQNTVQIKSAAQPAYAPAIGITQVGSGAATVAKPGGAYTIAWLSDTQHYHGARAEVFQAMTRYLRQNRSSLSIGYIALTGDIVGNGGSKAQWEEARTALDEVMDIPHGVLAGNHDYAKGKGLGNYKAYFGEAWYRGKTWYGGSYEDNRNHYDLVTLGATQYLFVSLSYQPREADIQWANSVFKLYPERVGVLLTHDYMDSKSNLRGNGRKLQEEIVRQNKNIYLVLCGHRYMEDNIPIQFDDDGDGVIDRTVYQCIANYQNAGQGGGGYIRFFRVDEAKGVIRFYTYSPYLNEYRNPPGRAKNPEDTWPIPWCAAAKKEAA